MCLQISNHSTSTVVKLYVSLVWSQFLYCIQKLTSTLDETFLDIKFCQLVHTKLPYSCYKTQLIKLKLLPLMYPFELQDILFAI